MEKENLFGVFLVAFVIIGIFLIINYSGDGHDKEFHEHSVEIEGKDLKYLTVQEVADLWEINSEVLLSNVVTEFELKGSHTVDTILEDIRQEYSFSPALIKDIAEDIKYSA